MKLNVTEDGCPTITYAFTLPVELKNKKDKTEEKVVPARPIAAQGTVKKKTGKTTKASEKPAAKKIFVPN